VGRESLLFEYDVDGGEEIAGSMSVECGVDDLLV
jgi:hypothetical protein